MSTRLLPQFEYVAFAPEVTSLMGEAFDRACLAFKGAPVNRVAYEAMANRIIEAALAGERDRDRLCEAALRGTGL